MKCCLTAAASSTRMAAGVSRAISRPPFISAYAAEDRCHLNGLAIVDGQPRYVTALGQSDTRGGWRAGKSNGGIVMSVPDVTCTQST